MSKQKQGILNRHRTARLSYTKRTNISEHYNFFILKPFMLMLFLFDHGPAVSFSFRAEVVASFMYILFQTTAFIILWFVCKIILNIQAMTRCPQ